VSSAASQPPSEAPSQPIEQALRALFAEIDAEVAARGPVCQISGRCCRFKDYGHLLFLSRVEADYLLNAGWPAYQYDENLCPFQVNGLCQARERRPTGCRVYFCDPAYAGEAEKLSERFIKRLKALHEIQNVAWNYQPLHAFLRERLEGQSPLFC
jgi:hypothetical protein